MTVNVAVAGLGSIGRIHAEIFHGKIRQAELTAVLDVDADLVESASRRLGVEGYLDYSDLLSDRSVDAVVVCTPTHLHPPMTLQAAEKGKHVLCEKPLAPSVEEARNLKSKVEPYLQRHRLTLQVGYMRRFDPLYAKARNLIREGRIGRILGFYSIARDPEPPRGWASNPKLSGGIFYDMLTHEFDLLRWILDSEPVELSVEAAGYLYEETRRTGDLDYALITLKFESGAAGVVAGYRRSGYGYDLRTEFHGETGTVIVGSPVDGRFKAAYEGGFTLQPQPWFHERFREAYIAEDRHFVECIEKSSPPLVGLEDGLKAVETAEACWKSYLTSSKVKLK